MLRYHVTPPVLQVQNVLLPQVIYSYDNFLEVAPFMTSESYLNGQKYQKDQDVRFVAYVFDFWLLALLHEMSLQILRIYK